MAFFTMFATADEAMGRRVREAPVWRQQDTAMFDNFAADARADAGREEYVDPEILLLRSIITHAPHPDRAASRALEVQLQPTKSKPDQIHQQQQQQQHLPQIPEVDWQKEVDAIMNVTEVDEENEDAMVVDASSQSHNHGTHNVVSPIGIESISSRIASSTNVLRHLHCSAQLDLDAIAPYSCFDINTVTQPNNDSDMLDVLLPNKFKGVDIIEEEGEQSVILNRTTGPFPAFAPPEATAFLTAQAKMSEEDTADLDEEVPAAFSSQFSKQTMSMMSREERQVELNRQKKARLDSMNLMALKNVNFNINSSANRFDDDGYFAKNSRGKSAVTAVTHSRVASLNLNVRPDLPAIHLKYFHRPRMSHAMRKRAWRISVKGASRKGGLSGRRRPTDNDRSDLSASTGDFVLIEYVEEFPPYMLNYGMASAMYNYYRGSGEGDAEEEHGRKRSERDAAHATLKAHGRLPRHVLLLLQHRDRKQAYEHDANIPRLQLGETKVLGESDASPFLGNLEEGDVQPSITNNLFRAPLFHHKPQHTDFLLICIRGGHTKSDLLFSIREIPAIFLAGQTEPQVAEAEKCVPRPLKSTGNAVGVNRVLKTQEQILALAIARFFHPENFDSTGVELHTVRTAILSDYTRDKQWSPQRELLRQKFTTLVKIIADESDNQDRQAQPGAVLYRPRDFYSEDISEEDQIKYSVDELCKHISPEDVCIDESSLAAEYRLRELGINDALPLQDVERWLVRQTQARSFRESHCVQIQYLYSVEVQKSGPMSADSKRLQKLVNYLILELKALDQKIKVGQFVFQRLLSAPWNTTTTFFNAHVQPDGLGRMLLTHELGDPSGRGEGYAFVRLLQERASMASSLTRRQGPALGKLHGTNQDLRKINDDDAIRLCVSFGLDAGEMRKLRRWDRIALIRGYATKAIEDGQERSGGRDPEMANLLMKFARGGSIQAAVQENKQSYRETCNEIWNRQRDALSSTVPPAADDSDEDDEDIFGDDKAIEKTIADKAVSLRKKKSEETAMAARMLITREDDQKELQSMRSMMAGGPSDAPETAAPTSSNQSHALQTRMDIPTVPLRVSGNKQGYVYTRTTPTQVVRRTIRTVYEDGTEVVTFQFLLGEREMKRFRVELERTARTDANASESMRKDRFGRMLDGSEDKYGPGGQRLPGASATGIKAPTLAINIGRIKDNVAKYTADSARAADIELHGEQYKTKQTSSRGGGFSVYRLPHVAFAALLEKELMALYSNKSAEFWQLWRPVPKDVPRYYEFIAEPISLSDIRENIASFKYLSYAQFCNDIELMVNNSRRFNSFDHPITKKAEEIKDNLKRMLEHDRRMLGIEFCELRHLEDCIRKKFLYLGRPMPSFTPVVPLVRTVVAPPAPTREPVAAAVPGPPPIPAHIGIPAAPLPAWMLPKQKSEGSLISAGLAHGAHPGGMAPPLSAWQGLGPGGLIAPPTVPAMAPVVAAPAAAAIAETKMDEIPEEYADELYAMEEEEDDGAAIVTEYF